VNTASACVRLQAWFNGPRQHASRFREESFQSVICTGTDHQTRTTKKQNTVKTI